MSPKSKGLSKKSSRQKASPETKDAARDRFVKDLLVRGEAQKPTKEGRLPLDATHVIVKASKDGTIQVKRIRTKLY